MSELKFIGNLVATTETYEGRDGKKHRKFLKVGAVFVRDTDDGKRLSIKMDAMPLSAEWNRWLAVYPKKDERAEEEAEYNAQRSSDSSEPQTVIDESEPINLDDIPF